MAQATCHRPEGSHACRHTIAAASQIMMLIFRASFHFLSLLFRRYGADTPAAMLRHTP